MAERFLDTSVKWELVWIAGARPPAHPKPMRGVRTFTHMQEALSFFVGLAPDAIFESLTMVLTERKDFSEDALKRIKRMKNGDHT